MAENWDDYASEYEAKFEDVTGSFAPRFVDWVNPQRNPFVVVDVGCGPGVVSMAMAERGAHVVGVDVSAAMIQRMEARATERGFASRVAGLVGSGESLGVPDRSAHACVSSFGIIYCPDVDAALREIARVTTKGGPLMITAWTTEDRNGWNTWLPDEYENELGFRVPKRTNLRWGSVDELRAALDRAGWHGVEIETVTSKPSVFASPEAVRDAFDTPPSRDMLSSLSDEQQEALKAYVVELARRRFGDGEVELPREAWIARGRA
jgi:SAM-dependent methyltransferase